ncbi:regulatory protein, luxR family [Streptomyces zhaozhouensis]|uniref:Regulatory protein, luxR family n=1 Tax=Streptomyces zhaozhouensis TaxID=1300267 RepID=A0A286DZP6_9ACTN|nr:LuxR C-terminal-related transcriptional regulator [Streptomyces zhaozhouensis]SOD64132.1 regulatory protein, luxR family [Streptomyces zhaozhouensis]
MSAPPPPPPAAVTLLAAPGRLRTTVATALRHAGVALAPRGALAVAAGDSVQDALRAGRAGPAGPHLVIANTVRPEGTRTALRAGVLVILSRDEATPARLRAAVCSAHHGEGRMSHDTLVRVLAGAGRDLPPPDSPLTARQTAVLALVAEGQGNAAIARALCCSEHTVKNVLYDLMARLQVRNRSHAVARAVRSGLI